MNAPRNAYAYGEFERFLLDTAKHDRAPQDLPARLGIALGLTVPILVATEVAVTLPTLTTVAGAGTVELCGTVAPTGLAATIKTALGLGASSLFGTAIKGVAVGVLSGTALLGTTHAVSKLTSAPPNPVYFAATVNVPSPVLPSLPVVNRSARNADTELAQVEFVAEPIGEVKTNPPSEMHATQKRVSEVLLPGKEVTTESVRKPPVPETTTAVGRFAVLGDDVSALYDTPKPNIAPQGAPPANEAVSNISAADLSALRKATVIRSRTLLGQGNAKKALEALDRFQNRVGAKNFGVSELLLRIEALADLGRAKEAQANVALVERLAPASTALRQAQQLARSRFVR